MYPAELNVKYPNIQWIYKAPNLAAFINDPDFVSGIEELSKLYSDPDHPNVAKNIMAVVYPRAEKAYQDLWEKPYVRGVECATNDDEKVLVHTVCERLDNVRAGWEPK